MIRVHHLTKVLDFDKGNLTVRAQTGVPLVSLRGALEKEGQYLWVAGEGTVGGVIATNQSAEPPLRDQILAMRVLLPNGEVVEFGAKTMKNVAGYDAAKLLLGSWGTLGVILDVTFRLFPYPATLLKPRETKPFLFKDIHKLIKKAFDPHDIIGQRTSMLTADEISAIGNESDQGVSLDYDVGGLGDNPWK